MIDGDITGNVTSDCQEMMQTQEMPEAHDVDCSCECCCKISQTNCQDNRSECEDAEQVSGRMRKMRKRFVPLLANGAVILAVIGFSGSINRISAIERIPIDISSIHSQVIPAIPAIPEISEISDIPQINGHTIDIAPNH